MSLARVLFVHHDLSHAIAITQIDKGQNAKITLLRHPTHENDLLAYIALAQFAARVGPF